MYNADYCMIFNKAMKIQNCNKTISFKTISFTTLLIDKNTLFILLHVENVLSIYKVAPHQSDINSFNYSCA